MSKQYKTIDQVLKRGWLYSLSLLLLIFLSYGVSSFIVFRLNQDPIYALHYAVLLGVILGLPLSNYLSLQWELWAFENTSESDWPLLKKKAIKQKLISSDDSIFRKFGFHSQNSRQRLSEISKRIEQLEAEKKSFLEKIQDDPQVAEKVEYHYRRITLYFSILFPLILALVGSYLLSTDLQVAGALFMLLAFFSFSKDKIKNLFNPEIQLSIDENGIHCKQLKSNNFLPWKDIQTFSLDEMDEQLNLEYLVNGDVQNIALDLPLYPIDDYDEFLRTLHVLRKRGY